MKYVCQDCGDTTNGDSDWDEWNCVVCGGRVVAQERSEVVPKSELREKIEKWRDPPEEVPDDMAELVASCADELEELL